jgi:hypothetical protein
VDFFWLLVLLCYVLVLEFFALLFACGTLAVAPRMCLYRCVDFQGYSGVMFIVKMQFIGVGQQQQQQQQQKMWLINGFNVGVKHVRHFVVLSSTCYGVFCCFDRHS